MLSRFQDVFPFFVDYRANRRSGGGRRPRKWLREDELPSYSLGYISTGLAILCAACWRLVSVTVAPETVLVTSCVRGVVIEDAHARLRRRSTYSRRARFMRV